MPYVTVTHNYKPHRYLVEQLPPRLERERWKVMGRNGFLILSNNRPVLIRRQLKYRPPDWRCEGDGLENPRFLELLYAAIDQLVRSGGLV